MLHGLWLRKFTFFCTIWCIGLLLLGGSIISASVPELPRIQTDQPLTLDQLLEAARIHNPDLQKAKLGLSINKLLTLGAIGEFLPALNVGYQISQNNYFSPTFTNPDGTVSSYPITSTMTTAYWDSLGYYRQGPTQTVTYDIPEGERRSSSLYIQLQTSLNLGGREFYDLSTAKKTVQVNELTLESTSQRVTADIRQQYYWVLGYQKLLELARQVLEQSKDLLELAQVRYDVGSVTQLDVMQAEIDVGNRQNDLMTAEHNLKMARVELNRLLGIDLSSEYPLVDDFRVSPPQYDLENLVTQALENRPDYRMSELNSEIYRNNVRKNTGNYFPSLSGSISHSRSEQSGGNVAFTLDPRNRSTSYSLGLSWTLFDGFAREVSLQEAKVSHRQAQLDKVTLQQSIEQSVRQAYYTLVRIWDQSKVTEKNRDLARRQLELEQERYRLGSASQLELRSSQVTYTQAETDHIYKTLEYLINLALLEEAVGVPIL